MKSTALRLWHWIDGRSVESLAWASALSYVALLCVSPLKWRSEPDSLLTAGWKVASWVYGSRLDNPHLAPLNNALFVGIGVVPVVLVYALLVRSALVGRHAYDLRLRAVLAPVLTASFALLFVPRMLSSDIFSYVSYGRLAGLYHLNPFFDGPAAHSDLFADKVGFQPFRYVASAYGPLFLVLGAIVSRLVELVGGSPGAYIAAYKLLAIGGHAGSVVCIWHLLAARAPARKVTGSVLYGFSPLVMCETGWNGHNDVLMLFFMLLALVAYTRGRPWLGIVPLACAVTIKWLPAAAVPIYAIVFARSASSRTQSVARFVGVGALSLVLVVGTFVPFWQGPSTLDALVHAPSNHFTTNSFADLVLTEVRREDFRANRGPDPDQMMASTLRPMVDRWWMVRRFDWQLLGPRTHGQLELWIRRATLAIFIATWCWWMVRARTFLGLVRGWTWTLFAYVTFAAVWFWPWYVVWVIGPAALLEWRRGGRMAAVFGVSAPAIYFTGLWGPWAYHARSIFALVPPLAMVLWQWHRPRIARSVA